MNHDEKIRTLDELSDFLDALDEGDAEARGVLRWIEIPPAAKPQRPYPYRIVSTTNVSHCRGKRARRQAFYARQRMARMLRRIMWARHRPVDLDAQVNDLLLHGTTWLQVSEAGVQRVPPSEWRSEFFGFDDQKVPPPDGSPRDGEIAAMRRTVDVCGFDVPGELLGIDDSGATALDRLISEWTKP